MRSKNISGKFSGNLLKNKQGLIRKHFYESRYLGTVSKIDAGSSFWAA